jgi:hypothetical protein
MNEQKRVKLTHGSARVDKNCGEETLKALDEMSKLAYEMESKPLKIDSVTKCEHPDWHNFSIDDWGKCKYCNSSIKT